MSDLLIVAGAVTTAVRIEKQLKREGISDVSVIHTPPVISSGGCSYSVKTFPRNFQKIKELMSEGKIRVKKLYSKSYVNGESVYCALS